MSDEGAVLAQRRGHVTLVQIDNAERRNSLSPKVLHALAADLAAAEADDDVRCIVIAGSEKVFASGADLRALFDAADLDGYLTPRFADWDAIRRLKTPLVAAVSGYCLGGGCELALSCDVIVAAPSALFGLPETSLGLIPGAGGTQLLARSIGVPKALDVILSGRLLSAEEAEQAGLVSRVAPQASWLDASLEVAEAIAARAPEAQARAKEAVRRGQDLSLSKGLAAERELFLEAVYSEEAQEGISAFLEKRQPAWQD